MEPTHERAAAIVEACDRALERLAGADDPELESLRQSVEAFRAEALARRDGAAGTRDLAA